MLVKLEDDTGKKSLRKVLLEKRNSTSGDLLKIAAGKIQDRLKKINAYKDASIVGIYYSIGSEIPTHGIIEDVQSAGKKICLPRVKKRDIEFCEISDFASLEMGRFDIMEPKERCPVVHALDVILVPSVGITPSGVRLGYGQGFYDRYLLKNSTVTISPVLEKQVVRNIPRLESDQDIDWIVTEDRTYNTSHAR